MSANWIARGDYSQIEARVICWLAGAEWKLDAFRAADAKTGPDVYIVAAAGIYRVPQSDISKDDPRRQVGKVSELALGFQGGARALQAMAKGYGLKIPRWDFDAEAWRKAWGDTPAPEPVAGTDEWIKREWRRSNPEIVTMWRNLESAAVSCMRDKPGTETFTCNGRIRFKRNSRAVGMRLPSGRTLFYWSPKLTQRRTPWGDWKAAITYRGENSQTHRWDEESLYGGLIAENAVQATARDIMADSLLRFEAAGLPPVLSVHDEGIAEAPKSRFPTAGDAKRAIEAVMRQAPSWATGLPIAADASADERYLKG